jgi:hypothetical protein
VAPPIVPSDLPLDRAAGEGDQRAVEDPLSLSVGALDARLGEGDRPFIIVLRRVAAA